MPPLQGIQVVSSGIHGYGVIALRHIAEGEIIVYGDGVLYNEDDDFDDEYSLIVPDDTSEDGIGTPMYYDLTDQTRWINHACDPNTEVDTSYDPDSGEVRAWWVALRDIKPGEELTYDYAFSAHLAIPCNCQMPRCRGLIVDEDEIDDVDRSLRPMIRRPRLAARA